MYKIKIFSIGKTKESWLISALEEYSKRLQKILSIEWVLAKNEEQLYQSLEKQSRYIALDPAGKLMTSENFSKFFHEALIIDGGRMNFLIGGSDGIKPEVKAKAISLLSLSPLTFTHQITRLILLEQIYRATEIEKGSSYHK